MSEQSLRKAVFIYSPQFERYSYPSENPFKTERTEMARKMLRSMGLLSDRDEFSPEPASRADLEKFHTSRYLDVMIAAEGGKLDVEGLGMGLGTGDCPVFVGMYEGAALGCGATLGGAKLILEGKADIAFNPAGGFHHAGPSRASGFCYLNDSALGCMALAEASKRVLYLDVDVHHGDGVQDAFYGRDDVMTISFHESGQTLFPGTGFPNEVGTGAGKGYSVNVPLPTGTGDESYMIAFRKLALPLIGKFDPDVIVMELGMDALAGDPLAHLNLTNNAYADLIEAVMRFDKPILAVGGGGYHPRNTARGWALAWSIMSGQDDQDIAAMGLGGVMLESTEWHGGLRDRALANHYPQNLQIAAQVDVVIETVKKNIFPLHGM